MTILATIIVLGVLIFVHELGHFVAAKAVGVDVERFSIGLGPRVVGVKRGETEYVLSAIPLGGYVKMGGMEDEILEAIEGGPSDEPREPGPGDLDGKPIWARAVVFSAGVIMNFLFAWLAYAAAVGFWGFQAPATTVVGDVRAEALTPGTEALATIQPGERIVAMGGEPVEHWGDVTTTFLEAPSGPLEIVLEERRDPLVVELPAGEEARTRLLTGFQRWLPPVIGDVTPGSAALDAGLEAGDRLVSVGGEPVESWWELVEQIEPRGDEATEVVLEREGMELVRTVTPESVESDDPITGATRRVGQVGIRGPSIFEESVMIHASVGEAVVAGFEQTVAITGRILGFLRDLVTGGVSPRSMGSIVTIGKASGEAASMGFATFLQFMGLFSVNLAVLNLLPIPILDGGHLLFLAIEAVRGKALSVEQRLRWSNVGFIIVMGIMVWALSNDVLTLLGL